MADAPTVVTNSNGDAPPAGNLFHNLSFFLARQLPARAQLVADVQSNGGRVVKLENQADFVIADHLRRDTPPGSYSYTLIEKAISNGAVPEDVSEHKIETTTAAERPVGSAMAGKRTRNTFTLEDDRILWEWVLRAKANNEPIKGNVLYQNLAAAHGRHTYQAWRDRYVKQLINKPPPKDLVVTVPANPPPSPPDDEHDEPILQEPKPATPRARKSASPGSIGSPDKFTKGDFNTLMEEAKEVEEIAADREDEAWERWAQVHRQHTAAQWRKFYEKQVRPKYLSRLSMGMNIEDNDLDVAEADRNDEQMEQHEKLESGSAKAMYQGTAMDPEGNRSVTGSAKSKRRPSDILERVQHKRRWLGSDDEESAAGHYSIAGKSSAIERLRSFASPRVKDGNGSVGNVHESYSSPASSRSNAEKWNSDEDDAVLLGLKHSWNISRIIQELPPYSDRSKDAVRSRRRVLRKRFEDGDVQVELDGHKSLTSVDQDDFVRVNHKITGRETQEASKPSATPLYEQGLSSGDLVTSDANQAANEQIMQEYEKQASNNLANLLDSQDSASDANRVTIAESEKGGSYADRDSLNDDNGLSVPSPALRTGDLDHESDDTGSIVSQPVALTEANLASHLEQHQPKVVRGVDLHEDEPVEDQTNFIKYLQDTLGKAGGAPLTNFRSDVGGLDSNPLEPLEAVVLQPERKTHRQRSSQNRRMQLLPLSSDDEIEQVWHSNLNWPASPIENSQEHVESQPSKPQPRPAESSKQTTRPLHAPRDLLREQTQNGMSDLPSSDAVLEDGNVANKLNEAQDNEYPAWGHPGEYGLADYRLVDDELVDYGIADYDIEEPDLGIAEPDDGFDSPAFAETRDISPPVVSRHRPTFPTQSHREAPDGSQDNIIELSSGVSSSSSYHSLQSSRAPDRHLSQQQGAVETQDILNAQTQAPDLGMSSPVPSNEFSADEEPDQPRPRSKRGRSPFRGEVEAKEKENEADDEADNVDELNAWIATMDVRGFPQDSIIKALKCTSMRMELAELVLYAEKAGQGLPRESGIWTERDDKWLEGSDARALRRLEDKHGADECHARMMFLQEWRQE